MRRTPDLMLAVVDDIGEEYARVTDSFGKRHDVRLRPRRGGGPLPQVGESWIMDQAYGSEWSFASLLIPNPIEVEGQDGGNTGVRDLLDKLESLGLITNLVSEGGGGGEGEGIIIPAGAIFPYGSESIPGGFLACDGAAYSRTEYDELFAVIGTTFGDGDGSTTFNVPDLIRRWPLGAGETAGAGRAGSSDVGDAGGEINHTHSGPSHNHSVNPPATWSGGASTTTAGTTYAHGGGDEGVSQHRHSVNIGAFSSSSAGTGQTGIQNPSYLVVQYIIASSPLRGEQGPQGDPGEDGSIWLSGAGAPLSGLGTVGDFYLDTASGNVFEKTDATTWTLRDNLTGPQGIKGDQGEPGEHWHSGSGAPAGGLGAVGDFYLNADNGDVYEKTGASTWGVVANITGPEGPEGPALTALGDIGDVDLTGVGDGDGIVYDEGTQTWLPGAAAGGDAGLEDILMLGGM